MQEIWKVQVRFLGQEDPLAKEMATHPSILAWTIPWTEEPGGLQSLGSQRVRHDWAGAGWWKNQAISSSFFQYFIYLFTFGCLCLHCSTWTSLVAVHGISGCDTWVYLLHNMWHLSSLTRDRTHIPCIGRQILKLKYNFTMCWVLSCSVMFDSLFFNLFILIGG